MWFNLFKRKKVIFLGRGGLIFTYHNSDYLIDSEMAFGDDLDIVIYKESIKLKTGNGKITAEHIEEVFHSLVEHLEKEEHLKVKIF